MCHRDWKEEYTLKKKSTLKDLSNKIQSWIVLSLPQKEFHRWIPRVLPLSVLHCLTPLSAGSGFLFNRRILLAFQDIV